jgi:aspartyl-tRNA(Asn)/glutamyl-tRNA(Gln) amidotransferase subunit A
MEMKLAVQQIVAGRSRYEIGSMVKFLLSLPETSMKNYIDAEQAVEMVMLNTSIIIAKG